MWSPRAGFDADEVLRLAASLDQVSRTCWPARSSPPDPARAGPADARGRPRGARLRPGGHRRRPSGQARQGGVDRRRRCAGVGAAGAPARRPGRLADRVRRRRRRAGRAFLLRGRDPAGRAPHGARAARGRDHPGRAGHRRPRRHRRHGRPHRRGGRRAGRLRPRRTNSPRSSGSPSTARRSWSATASTTRPRWPPPGWGSRLAARGATASSEAADVVLTVDRVDALADAILIARRSKRIALQAVLVGMGLSLVAMLAAAVGLLPPAAGAVVQEGIDVLAIGIALRAVLPGAVHTIAMPAEDVAIAVRLRAEHDAVLPLIETDPVGRRRAVQPPRRPRTRAGLAGSAGGRAAAARAGRRGAPGPAGRPRAGRLRLDRRDQPDPRRDRAPGRPAAGCCGTRRRGPGPEDVIELRRLLYGLYAVLRLHNAQEEEGAFSLVPDAAANHTA